MKNAAFAIVFSLIIAVPFITSTAGSDNLTTASFIQSTNASQKEEQSNMAGSGNQEESIPKFKVSEEDIARTKSNIQKRQSQLVVYTVVTLAVILVVITVLFGLWKDPLCCVFFTLCPCCLFSYPCLHFLLKKYNEPKKILQNNLQKYIPGVFYNDDGLLKRYKPTSKEIHCLIDIMRKIEGT